MKNLGRIHRFLRKCRLLLIAYIAMIKFKDERLFKYALDEFIWRHPLHNDTLICQECSVTVEYMYRCTHGPHPRPYPYTGTLPLKRIIRQNLLDLRCLIIGHNHVRDSLAYTCTRCDRGTIRPYRRGNRILRRFMTRVNDLDPFGRRITR